jgi:hypothetical protein
MDRASSTNVEKRGMLVGYRWKQGSRDRRKGKIMETSNMWLDNTKMDFRCIG